LRDDEAQARVWMKKAAAMGDIEANMWLTDHPEARAAHGPTLETDRPAEGGGPSATGGGCHARGTRAQLRRGKEHHFEALAMSMDGCLRRAIIL
jgi:hypothetical protein